jgi:hypothetical protein
VSQDKLDYFIERTDKDISEIKDDVKSLLAFKWQIVSGAAIVSGIVTLAIQLVLIYLKVQ